MLKHVVSVSSMAHGERASLKDVPLTLNLDLSNAANTAVEASSRAPWWAAPPTPNARASARNTAAVETNAFFGGCANKLLKQIGNMWKTCRTHCGYKYCKYAERVGGVLAGKRFTPALKRGGDCRKHTGK